MKHLFKTLFVIFAAVAVAACGKSDGDGGGSNPGGDTPGGDNPGNTPAPGNKQVTFVVTADQLTRTSVLDDQFLWGASETMAIAEVLNGADATTLKPSDMKLVPGLGIAPKYDTASFATSYPENTEAESFQYFLCYPYAAVSELTPGGMLSVTLPADQTPTALSFDPAASLLYGESETFSERVGLVEVNMNQLSAYVKLTVKNLGLSARKRITSVSLKNNGEDNLAGVCRFDTSDLEEYSKLEGSTTVTLDTKGFNITASRDFSLWFAVLPAEVDGYTVTITDADGEVYERPFDGTQVSFESGKVSEVEADMLGLVEKPIVSGEVFKYTCSEQNAFPAADGEFGNDFLIAAKIDDVYYTLANDLAFPESIAAVSFQDAGIGESQVENNAFVCSDEKYMWHIEYMEYVEYYYPDQENNPDKFYETDYAGYFIQSVSNPDIYLGVNGQKLSVVTLKEDEKPALFIITHNPFVDNRENIVKCTKNGQYLSLTPVNKEDLSYGFNWTGEEAMVNYKYAKNSSGEILLYYNTGKTE